MRAPRCTTRRSSRSRATTTERQLSSRGIVAVTTVPPPRWLSIPKLPWSAVTRSRRPTRPLRRRLSVSDAACTTRPRICAAATSARRSESRRASCSVIRRAAMKPAGGESENQHHCCDLSPPHGQAPGTPMSPPDSSRHNRDQVKAHRDFHGRIMRGQKLWHARGYDPRPKSWRRAHPTRSHSSPTRSASSCGPRPCPTASRR